MFFRLGITVPNLVIAVHATDFREGVGVSFCSPHSEEAPEVRFLTQKTDLIFHQEFQLLVTFGLQVIQLKIEAIEIWNMTEDQKNTHLSYYTYSQLCVHR